MGSLDRIALAVLKVDLKIGHEAPLGDDPKPPAVDRDLHGWRAACRR
jgi:hypothetical protein